MLPQTRQKLRLFSAISLIVGCLFLALIWFSASPEVIVKGERQPTFKEVLLAKPNFYDVVQWKLMDLTISFDFFSTLLRAIVMLTICTSVLSIVVVFNDIRLTKK